MLGGQVEKVVSHVNCFAEGFSFPKLVELLVQELIDIEVYVSNHSFFFHVRPNGRNSFRAFEEGTYPPYPKKLKSSWPLTSLRFDIIF
jgi:hypothetical protein